MDGRIEDNVLGDDDVSRRPQFNPQSRFSVTSIEDSLRSIGMFFRNSYVNGKICCQSTIESESEEKVEKRRKIRVYFVKVSSETYTLVLKKLELTVYLITKTTPKSKVVQCSEEFARSADYPPQYRAAREYHGLITREQTDVLLGNVEGAYLVRASRRESNQLSFTLAFRLFDVTKNYKLKYEARLNVHYLEDGGPETRHYNKVSDMVDDALITYYVESRAADILGRMKNGDFTETGEYASRLDRLDRAAGSRYWTYGNAQPMRIQARGQPILGQRARNRASAQRPSDRTGFRPIPDGDSPTSQSQSPSNASADGSPLRSTRTAPSGSVGVTGPPPNRYDPEPERDSLCGEVDFGRHVPRKLDHVPESRQSHLYEPGDCSSDTYENNLVSALECEDESVDGRSTATSAFDLSTARDKAHAFAVHTFAGAHFCDFCTHFLWGIIQQGVKCRDCGFKAHKQCAQKVPPDCVPAMKHLRRLFGAELTTAALIQPSDRQRLLLASRFMHSSSPSASSQSSSLSNRNLLVPGVPFVVQQCIKEVEVRGMHFEGIYRIPGNHDDVEALKVAYDRDETVDLSRVEEVHTVTSVLKSYFRSLPIPLITYEAYDDFIAAVRATSVTVSPSTSAAVREQLREALSRLPAVHRCTLEYLMRHLSRVTDYQPKNMMSAENLSIVFAPTLMRSCNTDPVESLNNLRFERLVVQRLITDVREMFAVGLTSQPGMPTPPSPRSVSSCSNPARRDSCPQPAALLSNAASQAVRRFGLPQSTSQCDISVAPEGAPANQPPPPLPPPPAQRLGAFVQSRTGWEESDIAQPTFSRAV